MRTITTSTRVITSRRRQVRYNGDLIPVHENGLAGIFYKPSGPGSYPGIIILRGAEGGLRADQAALLASHGFAGLALAYYNYDGLPTTLANIPLEYFQAAIHWLQAQENVRADRVAVLGASRGGELALLLGASFSNIKVVVAYVPSSHIGPAEDSIQPAWTFHGTPMPYVHDFGDDSLFAHHGSAFTFSNNKLYQLLRRHPGRGCVCGCRFLASGSRFSLPEFEIVENLHNYRLLLLHRIPGHGGLQAVCNLGPMDGSTI
jgi:acetyl esterase/lipase